MPDKAARAGGIQVLHRAADVLRVLQTAPAGLSQAEIASRLHLATSTVHRIVGALEEEGFVAGTASGGRARYRLGSEIARLAGAVRRSLIGEFHPLLEQLSAATGETADLAALDHNRVTFIDQVVAPNRLRAVSAIGESFPVHCTANGKAILAAMPPGEVAALVAPMAGYTPHTITDPERLEAELAVVRRDGVAFDRGEHTEGICAVGAVVGDVLGETVAVSVPMPAQRFAGREDELAALLLDVLERHRPSTDA
ncbi:IclR family transcriptional regulator [Solicola sp. PLA-1-18]|uniref:IclR family transcriptional regulator n=1 Tax=Solicola sp. PLA-1-18 TaxID=3380532 RepID=UPI003B7641E0